MCAVKSLVLPAHDLCAKTSVWADRVGLVFLAFALNLVDTGALLGGRLDENVVPVQVDSKKEKAIKRSATMHASTVSLP